MQPLRRIYLPLVAAALLVLGACGGNVRGRGFAGSITAGGPATPTTPTTPTTPGGTVPVPPTTFAFNIAFLSRGLSLPGHIVVNAAANDGSATLTLTGETPSTTFNVSFCPYGALACIAITQVGTDAQGNASLAFKFPQVGTWSGVFELVSTAGDQKLFSGTVAGVGAPNVTAHMVKAAAVTTGLPGFVAGTDPLIWGAITVDANANGTIEVHGAEPVDFYIVQQCLATPSTTGHCQTVSSMSTDSTGFGTAAFFMQSSDPSIFVLTRGSQAEFVTGFLVQ